MPIPLQHAYIYMDHIYMDHIYMDHVYMDHIYMDHIYMDHIQCATHNRRATLRHQEAMGCRRS